MILNPFFVEWVAMEIVASAASVTGILAFAGQALSGLLALKEFLEAIKYAPEETKALLDNIRGLHKVLDGSRDLISQCANNSHPALQSALSQLSASIQNCSFEIGCWYREPKLQQMQTIGVNRWKVMVQRVSQAGNKELWQRLSRRVSAQRDRLILDLSLLGRIYDQLAYERRLQLESQLKQLERDVDSMSEKLSSVQSSVSSIASSLSVIKKTGDSQLAGRDVHGTHWTCDALTGIDDGFVHDGPNGLSRCRFCSKEFIWDDQEVFSRLGNHLVNFHAFGKCSLGIFYHTQTDIIQHLTNFHHLENLEGDGSDLVDLLARPNDLDLSLRSRRPEPQPVPIEGDPNECLRLLPRLEELLRSVEAAREQLGMSRKQRMQMRNLANRRVDDGNRDVPIFHICRSLALLDDEHTIRALKRNGYFQICYEISCIQEELTIVGFEDILRYEVYLSPSQLGIIRIMMSGKQHEYRATSRIYPRWIRGTVAGSRFQTQTAPSQHLFATLTDAHTFSYGSDLLANRGLHKSAFDRSLHIFRLNIQRASDTETVESQTEHQASSIEQLVLQDGKRSRKTARRIDTWLLGNFIHSIPTRRLLLSGKVRIGKLSQSVSDDDPWQYLPQIHAINAVEFAQVIIANWSDVGRFGKIKTCNSVAPLHSSEGGESGDRTVEAGSGWHTDGVEVEFTDTSASDYNPATPN
ncbi:uncharacterized protein F4822DRAFT_189004 [Hypoxylon trugodes]|uniref:uncharacterized protein n=1 Tax=Hypoxylon trugodes TaxID=326681 RepID=UPI00219EF66A|nr:uncharacterized protein F4822DRAFT_189004 [Hypoxylon trugodes]KAI1391547.1 hypothetical protein F4822DRAFT_189004 [Hypoxylon trugodes]